MPYFMGKYNQDSIIIPEHTIKKKVKKYFVDIRNLIIFA